MPRNPDKRHCQVPGCRAWAKRGYDLCASHLRSRAMRENSDQIMPLLQVLSLGSDEHTLKDLDLINKELCDLFAAREMFMKWVKEQREDHEQPNVPPAQFLRAWNDSTTRVIQLLRARRDLGEGAGGEFDALMEGVYDIIEGMLPEAGKDEGRGPA